MMVTRRRVAASAPRLVLGWGLLLLVGLTTAFSPNTACLPGRRGGPAGGEAEEGGWASSGLEGPLDGTGDDADVDDQLAGGLKASMLRAVLGTATDAAQAGGAAMEEEEEPLLEVAAPAAKGKRTRVTRRSAAMMESMVVKTEDDVCRATVAVVSSGDEEDLAMLTPFVERLLTRYGDRLEILHQALVPEEKPGLRLLEIWFEGFESFALFSRYKFLKKGKRGELTPETIDEMCAKIDYAMYMDATGDFGPF